MNHACFVSTDEIRTRFSTAMSEMYRLEVPHYARLMELVTQVNARVLQQAVSTGTPMLSADEQDRLSLERHGAIRLGTPQELHTMRRLFAVMGMQPVGYYDLSPAGVPVHSTAFRPVDDAALARNPFRVFTSLLRLELIDDLALRAVATDMLNRRRIFTDQALTLITRHEREGGLTSTEADEFVSQALETFRWHREATVDASTYHRLHEAHRLIADVVCFKGPHINHLTPRTLDIDAVQAEMPSWGMDAKESIEGPPRRQCPILLRQTSFKALQEPVIFTHQDSATPGTHTARFGEVEQRGQALTRQGRALYDRLLAQARQASTTAPDPTLSQIFTEFPDDLSALRRAGLGFFRYAWTNDATAASAHQAEFTSQDLDRLVNKGWVTATPITYEDFLPVSAAGIFQSNLGGTTSKHYNSEAAQSRFEEALGAPVLDEMALYAALEQQSIEALQCPGA